MLKLVNVGPDFSLQRGFVCSAFAAGGAAGVQGASGWLFDGRSQLNKHATHLLNFLVVADEVFIAKQKSETQLAGVALGLNPGVKGPVLGA